MAQLSADDLTALVRPDSDVDERTAESALRPTTLAEFEGQPIPEILVSGDHARVAAWRQAEAESLTQARRPDLWAARTQGQKRPKNTREG